MQDSILSVVTYLHSGTHHRETRDFQTRKSRHSFFYFASTRCAVVGMEEKLIMSYAVGWETPWLFVFLESAEHWALWRRCISTVHLSIGTLSSGRIFSTADIKTEVTSCLILQIKLLILIYFIVRWTTQTQISIRRRKESDIDFNQGVIVSNFFRLDRSNECAQSSSKDNKTNAVQ